VDKNPAQYGRFSERVLEIIRRFEEGQIATADGLREFEDLTGGINAEQGAHSELGMDERAFSILRIIEALASDIDHATLQAAAIAIGAVYADAQASQPAFTHMQEYLRSLRQRVRRILSEHDIGETKVIRDAVEEFAIIAYAGAH
jgi:type I restriction enzyme, R subunit